MQHYELFQMMLNALNSYGSHTGNTTTGVQRIAIARACEALYSAVEGCPRVSVEVDINASVIALNKPSEKPSKRVQRLEADNVSFDPLPHLINPDSHTRLIAT